MKFDAEDNRWLAEYPWIKDPADLPDNRRVALSMLYSTERRLGKNTQHATVYDNQVRDMVQRGVARKLTKEELINYKGPIHYISHHEGSNQTLNLLPLESCLTVAQTTWVTYLMSTGQRDQTCSTVCLEYLCDFVKMK